MLFLLNKDFKRSLAFALASDELGRNRDDDSEPGLDVVDDNLNELFLKAASLSLAELLDPLDRSKLPELDTEAADVAVVVDGVVAAVVVVSFSSFSVVSLVGVVASPNLIVSR